MIRFIHEQKNNEIKIYSISSIKELQPGVKLNDFGYYIENNDIFTNDKETITHIIVFCIIEYIIGSCSIIDNFLESQEWKDFNDPILKGGCFPNNNPIKVENTGLYGTNNTTTEFKLFDNSNNTSMFNWGNPERLKVEEYQDKIEMIYKQTSTIVFTSYPSPPPAVRLFKIIFSCVDGKWNKSAPIFGKIIPAQDEYYEFEDEK